LARDNVCCPSWSNWLLGLSFYRSEPWVRNAVIYTVNKKWTATSALIFNAVLLFKNQPQAQRRAVAAKGI
jgi:hypothetical protein